MAGLHLGHQLGAHQTLSPRLQKAVKLLQMPAVDFLQAIEETLGENPFLEKDEASPSPPPDTPAMAETRERTEMEAWGASMAERHGLGRTRGDFSAIERIAQQTSLSAHLHGQLRLLSLDDRTFVLASAMVESLDPAGYLLAPLEEIDAMCGLPGAASQDELLRALSVVQNLDPVGVGARTLVECLQLQLPALASEEDRAMCTHLLAREEDLRQHKSLSVIARSMHCSAADAHHALQCLRRLDPHPGWRFAMTTAPYVQPDILVRKVRGCWTARLNEEVMPRLHLNRVYAKAVEDPHLHVCRELSEQLREARWTMHNIEQRFSTILDVASAILRRQQGFFEYGPMAMRPLSLREIAEEVGVHESTACRVTNQKYMATPSGTFELKFFFSRGMNSVNNTTLSPIAVRSLVQKIIAGEKKTSPLSDVAVAEQLQRQGIRIARRTVTKYRRELGLKAAEKRIPPPPE